ncbi:hypothetical protein GGF46_003409 [Coemansia sp. RSA 552]|nr:hypothetical protein GGF46_003409 [Coemansia sp. RSA 552]
MAATVSTQSIGEPEYIPPNLDTLVKDLQGNGVEGVISHAEMKDNVMAQCTADQDGAEAGVSGKYLGYAGIYEGLFTVEPFKSEPCNHVIEIKRDGVTYTAKVVGKAQNVHAEGIALSEEAMKVVSPAWTGEGEIYHLNWKLSAST